MLWQFLRIKSSVFTLHPIHPIQPSFYPKIKAIVFLKKMMARKKKMTAF